MTWDIAPEMNANYLTRSKTWKGKRMWKKPVANPGRTKIKCLDCGDIFIHFTVSRPQPGRKKFCDVCKARRVNGRNNIKYVKKKKL